jgi:hypothetical protein
MLSIRDSVEPKEWVEDDAFKDSSPPTDHAPPPIDATPIVFDLPSTTSVLPSSTTAQTQLSKTNRRRNNHADDCITVAPVDIWDFPTDSPASTKRNVPVDESPRTTTKRRNSLTAIDVPPNTPKRGDRAGSLDLEESPAIRRKRRKSAQRIDDSDDDVVEVKPKKGKSKKGSREEVHVDELVTGDASPRKKFVAVEIPTKKQAKAKRGKSKKPLEEIVIAENIIDVEAATPISSAKNSAPRRYQTPPLAKDVVILYEEELENVVRTTVVEKRVELPRPPQQIEKSAPAMSAVRPTNVASILSKSPNRPVYRVGLSRRMNVEPLHGYLRRKS